MIQMRFFPRLGLQHGVQGTLPCDVSSLWCHVPLTSVFSGKQKIKCRCWISSTLNMGEECLWLFSRRQIKASPAVLLQTSPDVFIDSLTISNTAQGPVNTCHSVGATNSTAAVSFPYLITNGLLSTKLSL